MTSVIIKDGKPDSLEGLTQTERTAVKYFIKKRRELLEAGHGCEDEAKPTPFDQQDHQWLSGLIKDWDAWTTPDDV